MASLEFPARRVLCRRCNKKLVVGGTRNSTAPPLAGRANEDGINGVVVVFPHDVFCVAGATKSSSWWWHVRVTVISSRKGVVDSGAGQSTIEPP